MKYAVIAGNHNGDNKEIMVSYTVNDRSDLICVDTLKISNINELIKFNDIKVGFASYSEQYKKVKSIKRVFNNITKAIGEMESKHESSDSSEMNEENDREDDSLQSYIQCLKMRMILVGCMFLACDLGNKKKAGETMLKEFLNELYVACSGKSKTLDKIKNKKSYNTATVLPGDTESNQSDCNVCCVIL